MPYSFARSEALFRRAQLCIVSGVNSGIRKMESPVPLYFERGSGPNLWDVDGNHYLDFQLGFYLVGDFFAIDYFRGHKNDLCYSCRSPPGIGSKILFIESALPLS